MHFRLIIFILSLVVLSTSFSRVRDSPTVRNMRFCTYRSTECAGPETCYNLECSGSDSPPCKTVDNFHYKCKTLSAFSATVMSFSDEECANQNYAHFYDMTCIARGNMSGRLYRATCSQFETLSVSDKLNCIYNKLKGS